MNSLIEERARSGSSSVLHNASRALQARRDGTPQLYLKLMFQGCEALDNASGTLLNAERRFERLALWFAAAYFAQLQTLEAFRGGDEGNLTVDKLSRHSGF